MLLREREKALSSSGQKRQASVAGLSRLSEQILSPQGGGRWEEGGGREKWPNALLQSHVDIFTKLELLVDFNIFLNFNNK